ncbi:MULTISPECIES: sensor histidine kinase [Hyphobacterium]|uniref:histidine kinase n=1 Tax=Hyphobacterium vulgare TaxID=1736751 RepID=A0ABV6ZUZ5_9PROT
MIERLPILSRRTGALIAGLIWLGGLALTATSVTGAAAVSPLVAGVCIAIAAIPALALIVMRGRTDQDLPRLTLSLLWTALAASAAAACGGVTGLAAMAFLLPPAAASAGGRRGHVIEAAALSGFSALAIGALQFGGLLVAPPGAAMVFAPVFPVAAAFIASGFALSALRSVAAHDKADRAARTYRVKSAAFDATSAPLAVVDGDEIIAGSAGLRRLIPGLPRTIEGLPFAALAHDDDERDQLAEAMGRLAGASTRTTIRGAGGRAAAVTIEGAATADATLVTSFVRENADSDLLRRERDEALSDAAAKTEYLASVSHEIRTPLNAIIGFSEVMKARLFGPLPARYAEYADLIHESGRHLLDLIGDVLDMSKIEAERYELTMDRFDAGDVVGICTKLLRQRAEDSGITLETDLPEGEIAVEADRKALRQILLNLLSNAIKFTPPGGAVVAMARGEGSDLIIAVGDSGVGIAPEEVHELGQRFRQASNSSDSTERGSGLGLSLVRSLAELHGGTMSIESRINEGTTVTVRLPVIDVTASDAKPETLEVHDRIRRAQEAGNSLSGPAVSATGTA